ncbi:MAG: IS110 family transposase [Candidatus Woesearchaeota archaeon]
MQETKFYIGLDVHSKSTDYVVRTLWGDIVLEGKCASTYQDLKEQLQSYYHSCVVGIEACTFFYPLRAGFLGDDVVVRVANVLRIRQLVSTNDRVDARRLSDMLRLGTFPESYIPDKDVQELRDLVVLRHSFLQELNRMQSRIWAHITRKGIRVLERSLFSKKGFLVVKQAAESLADTNLKMLIIHYEAVGERLEQATASLISFVKEHFPDEWSKLQEIDGIGPITSSYIIAEACPITRFSSEKKLRRYAGVIPVTQDSAGKSYGNRIPKTTSRALLRWAFVQAAHGAVRKKSSKLREYYRVKKKAKGKGTIMIIARAISDKVYASLN